MFTRHTKSDLIHSEFLTVDVSGETIGIFPICDGALLTAYPLFLATIDKA